MAFGSPPTYHKYRLPSTGKAGFQVLVRLSCTGFPPAGLLQKVSNSRHVCFPPFPGFLTQFAPLRGNSRLICVRGLQFYPAPETMRRKDFSSEGKVTAETRNSWSRAMPSTISLTVNGKKQSITTDPQRPLLQVLREDLGLTGTKYGCGEGRCGACTVLMDGKRTHSCQLPVADADGKKITTIEGIAKDGDLASRAGSVSGRGRHAVRLLHARYDPEHRGAAGEEPAS